MLPQFFLVSTMVSNIDIFEGIVMKFLTTVWMKVEPDGYIVRLILANYKHFILEIIAGIWILNDEVYS